MTDLQRRAFGDGKFFQHPEAVAFRQDRHGPTKTGACVGYGAEVARHFVQGGPQAVAAAHDQPAALAQQAARLQVVFGLAAARSRDVSPSPASAFEACGLTTRKGGRFFSRALAEAVTDVAAQSPQSPVSTLLLDGSRAGDHGLFILREPQGFWVVDGNRGVSQPFKSPQELGSWVRQSAYFDAYGTPRRIRVFHHGPRVLPG